MCSLTPTAVLLARAIVDAAGPGWPVVVLPPEVSAGVASHEGVRRALLRLEEAGALVWVRKRAGGRRSGLVVRAVPGHDLWAELSDGAVPVAGEVVVAVAS